MDKLDFRLVGGSKPSEGRLEVFFEDFWGTVCDDRFNDAAGQIICQYFNYRLVIVQNNTYNF